MAVFYCGFKAALDGVHYFFFQERCVSVVARVEADTLLVSFEYILDLYVVLIFRGFFLNI